MPILVGCVPCRKAEGRPQQVGAPTLGGNLHRETFMESDGEMRCLRSPNSIGTPHSRFFTPLGPSAKVRGTPGRSTARNQQCQSCPGGKAAVESLVAQPPFGDSLRLSMARSLDNRFYPVSKRVSSKRIV